MLGASVAPDMADGVIYVELRGLLSLQSAPTARAVLAKCLAQGPDAVIVDVAGLRVEQRSRLTVFPAAQRTHSGPPVILMLCGATPALAALMSGGVLGDVGVYRDRDAARTAVAQAQVVAARRKVVRLVADPAAPSRARALVGEACREWDVEHLRGSAGLVISELVSNAVQHAGTDILVRVARRGDFLHLSVHDRSAEPPLVGDADPGSPPAVRGRGLHLVDVYTTAWGSNVTSDGKTVWATLRAVPLAGR